MSEVLWSFFEAGPDPSREQAASVLVVSSQTTPLSTEGAGRALRDMGAYEDTADSSRHAFGQVPKGVSLRAPKGYEASLANGLGVVT